jgi:hypothetical protein
MIEVAMFFFSFFGVYVIFVFDFALVDLIIGLWAVE